MDARAVRAFVRRDRAAVEALKRAYWACRFREDGAQATLQMARGLFEYARRVRPDWPTARDRAEDLAHHIELEQLLHQAAGGGFRAR